MKNNKIINEQQEEKLLQILEERFETNKERHPKIMWTDVVKRLKGNQNVLWSLEQMEISGGEPDIIHQEEVLKKIVFYDCSKESPLGRRSLCYDEEALASRKKNKPQNSALGMTADMGVEILDEDDYRKLQKVLPIDFASSSWIKTPEKIRQLGGGLFGDRRYETVFIYHNGVESYYAGRGFRSKLVVP